MATEEHFPEQGSSPIGCGGLIARHCKEHFKELLEEQLREQPKELAA